MDGEISERVSPDGSLTLLVIREGDDVTIGFKGHPWHTHADVLAASYATSQEAAVTGFVGALLGNKAVVAIATVAGHVADVWVCDTPSEPDPYKPADEVIVFRFWDGTPRKPPAPVVGRERETEGHDPPRDRMGPDAPPAPEPGRTNGGAAGCTARSRPCGLGQDAVPS